MLAGRFARSSSNDQRRKGDHEQSLVERQNPAPFPTNHHAHRAKQRPVKFSAQRQGSTVAGFNRRREGREHRGEPGLGRQPAYAERGSRDHPQVGGVVPHVEAEERRIGSQGLLSLGQQIGSRQKEMGAGYSFHLHHAGTLSGHARAAGQAVGVKQFHFARAQLGQLFPILGSEASAPVARFGKQGLQGSGPVLLSGLEGGARHVIAPRSEVQAVAGIDVRRIDLPQAGFGAHALGIGWDHFQSPLPGQAERDSEILERLLEPALHLARSAAGLKNVPNGNQAIRVSLPQEGLVQQNDGRVRISLRQTKPAQVQVGTVAIAQPVHLTQTKTLGEGLVGLRQSPFVQELVSQTVPGARNGGKIALLIGKADTVGYQRGGVIQAALPRAQQAQLQQRFGTAARESFARGNVGSLLRREHRGIEIAHFQIDPGNIGVQRAQAGPVVVGFGNGARLQKRTHRLAITERRKVAGAQVVEAHSRPLAFTARHGVAASDFVHCSGFRVLRIGEQLMGLAQAGLQIRSEAVFDPRELYDTRTYRSEIRQTEEQETPQPIPCVHVNKPCVERMERGSPSFGGDITYRAYPQSRITDIRSRIGQPFGVGPNTCKRV